MTPRSETTATPLAWHHIAPMLLGRLTVNTAFRMIYPLLAFLAAGLAVDLRTASLLVTIQVGATLLSPLGGLLSDARGERTTMLWGLVLFCAGALVCALSRSFVPFLLGYGVIGMGTALYQPALQAYVSARTGYARRGRVLGILELGWALAALIGVTTMTRLVEASNAWSPAFWVLLGMGLLVMLWTLAGLPRVNHPPVTRTAAERRLNLAALTQASVIGVLTLMMCTLAAIELILVVYAGWLQADFRATTEQLGLIFGILGFVELGGSLGATLLVDRLGKRRSVILGFILTALLQALLPLSSGNWALFLLLFLLLGLCFEFAIVSTFPLVSGVAPLIRGTVLALGVAAMGTGRVLGSLVGTPLWQNFGFIANGLLACGLTSLGVVVCVVFVREGEQADHAEQPAVADSTIVGH